MKINRRELLGTALVGGAAGFPRTTWATSTPLASRADLPPEMPVPLGVPLDLPVSPDPTLHRLDRGWLFHEGDIAFPAPRGNDETYAMTKAGNAPGAAGLDYDDGAWRAVTIPHDWAIAQPIEKDQNDAWAYRRRGIGWYRRSLRLEEAWRGKYLELQLGGIATNATVWFNGIPVAHSFSGYVQQNIDISPYARFGAEANTIAIRVDAESMEGWWYEGAGIYRDCWLAVRPALHIATDGVHADPRPAGDESWRIPIEVTLTNCGRSPRRGEVRARLVGADGSVLASGGGEIAVAQLKSEPASFELRITRPLLWSVDEPNLYALEVELAEDGAVIDRRRLKIGFRTVRFDAATGFLLNGKSLKIKGVCIHQDHAGVGVAVPASLIEWRVRRLKDIGCNAIRSSHHASSATLLDICDRLGMLVMGENRNFNPSQDYLAQLRWMVRRDRNRPCVIMWSVLNEEPMQGSPQGFEMVRRLAAAVKELDDSRPVTAAMNDGFFNPVNGADAVDLVGFNYKADWYDRYHALHPERPMISTEDTSAVMTRGEWANDAHRNVLTSYDSEAPEWGLTHHQSWKMISSRPFVAGTFVWTGFDYHGEPTPLPWPAATSSFGILDLCGFGKMAYHLRRAQWIEDRPVIAIGPHWNWPGLDGKPIRVMVPTNAEETELLLNGRSLGRQPVKPFVTPEWQVPYAPGTIEAIAYRNGRAVARARQETAGPAAKIRLTADRPVMAASGRDVQPISVDLIDRNGRHLPTATDRIEFSITGGEIIGVGNGNPNDHDSEQAGYRNLFAGLAQVLVRAGRGQRRLTLTATANGLPAARLVIAVTAPGDAPEIDATPGAQVLSQWRRTAFSAAPIDPARIYAPADWRKLDYVRAGRLEPAQPTAGRAIIQGRFTPRGLVVRHGGELTFAGIVGKAELWIDGRRIATKAAFAEGPLSAPIPPGAGEHTVSLVIEASAGEAVGLSRSVCVWPQPQA